MPRIVGVRQAFIDFRRDDADQTNEADLSAAQAHFEALELELRRPDRSVVPTEWIAVTDTEVTLSFAREEDLSVPDPLFAETDEEKRLIADIEHDQAIFDEWFGDDWDEENDRPWEEQPSFPRYQIQVELIDDAAIP